MAIVERHQTPDGLLDLIVDQADDGDWTFAFVPAGTGHEEINGHTHGDLEQQTYGGTPTEATRHCVDDLLNSRRAFIVFRQGTNVRDVWLEDDLNRFAREEISFFKKFANPGEEVERRLWNGSVERA